MGLKSLHVVTLDDADVHEAGQHERLVEVVQKVAGFSGVARLFFDENAVHWKSAGC